MTTHSLSISDPKVPSFSYGPRWPCDTWPDHFGPPCQAALALIPSDFELGPFRTGSDPGRLRTRAKLLRTTSGETLVLDAHDGAFITYSSGDPTRETNRKATRRE